MEIMLKEDFGHRPSFFRPHFGSGSVSFLMRLKKLGSLAELVQDLKLPLLRCPGKKRKDHVFEL
jgi:hypothetical protein